MKPGIFSFLCFVHNVYYTWGANVNTQVFNSLDLNNNTN